MRRLSPLLACFWIAVGAGCSTPIAGNAPVNYAAGDTLLPHDALVIPSATLGEDRPVNVWLPPEYAAEPARRFPVLYMPDGGVQEDFPHVSTTVSAMVADGEIAPMIVVGVANTVRRRDLTPPTAVASDREVAPVIGGAPQFRSFLVDELQPEIDRRYRTDGWTALLGESLAGLFIVDTFFERPGAFDAYLALSPSLWWNDEALVRQAPDWFDAHPDAGGLLYLTSADEDNIAPQTARLAAALAAFDGDVISIYRPRPDLDHSTIYRATKRDALGWMSFVMSELDDG